MKTPFENDPFSLVFQAFKKLYPQKDCECYWKAELEPDEDGHNVLGLTTYTDDGRIYIDISVRIPVMDAVEIFAHELAHVAAGPQEEHGKAWEDAFDAIHSEYNRASQEETPGGCETVKVVSGKEYTRENERKE